MMLLFPVFASAAAALLAALSLSYHSLPTHIPSIFHASRSPNGRLSFSPNRLSALDSAFIILLILAKYIVKLLHKAPRLSFTSDGKSFALPPLSLAATLEVNEDDIRDFNKAVRNVPSHSDANSPLMLAALTTPMMLILLSNASCPILPFGAVNTKNRFEFVDPTACRRLSSLQDAVVTARLGGRDLPGRRVKRGMEFEVLVEVASKIDGDAASRKVILRQVISILTFLSKSTKPVWSGEAEPSAAVKPFAAPAQHFSLDSHAPSMWARVCNDINPIHMSSLAARLFGFRGKIAHGNHVVAIVAEKARGGDLKGGMRRVLWESSAHSFLEVVFRRPMVLPIALQTRYADGGLNGEFEVVGEEGKIYVEGRWGEL